MHAHRYIALLLRLQNWKSCVYLLEYHLPSCDVEYQVWSNDAYESVEHRAIVNSEKERFSIPYFFFPAHDTEVKPLEELINEKSPSKYRPYKSGKFLLSRMNSNFKKQTEENLQIHYYKLA
ncbi:hypothetical protein Ahy_B10g102925 [Arachis hypogaea]|uniref:Isopenicillin N synthase-like Fe(2+) 2OG dioxygenase domain-containing protein n=1 Tax=Arachis hypogaea TaxID=3818 RepID=A0A444X311_ARAHY|nr:hypothetical protein Ahy_B10g102925 [Arachis hypogaea]